MLRYRFLNNTKEWVVVGPAKEVRPGPVTVTKMDGEPKPETIERVSKPYEVDGIQFRFGYLAKLPKGHKPKTAPLPPTPVEVEEKPKNTPLVKVPDISDAVLDVAGKNRALMVENARTNSHLIRLLNYVLNMREDFADLDWPDLPDEYGSKIWKAAS